MLKKYTSKIIKHSYVSLKTCNCDFFSRKLLVQNSISVLYFSLFYHLFIVTWLLTFGKSKSILFLNDLPTSPKAFFPALQSYKHCGYNLFHCAIIRLTGLQIWSNPRIDHCSLPDIGPILDKKEDTCLNDMIITS